MFEFSRNPKIALSVDNHFDECTLSQEKGVPTDRQTLSMHRYVLIESHRILYPPLPRLCLSDRSDGGDGVGRGGVGVIVGGPQG